MAPTLVLAVLALSFSNTVVLAAPSEHIGDLIKRAVVVPTVASPWMYQGCYSDSVNARTFSVGYPGGQQVTDEVCIQYCGSNGYHYAGTEYTDECYCGNSLPNTAVLSPDSDCSMGCQGNMTEACGGPNRLTVFFNPNGPVTNPGPGNWGSLGCYTDSAGARTLTTGQAVPGGNGVDTVTLCTTACQQGAYQYAGVEYGGECYCGNVFSNGGGPAPDGFTGCNMVCNGNSSEFCGGPNRLNVYGFGAPKPTSSSSSTTTVGSSSSSSPASSSSTSTTKPASSSSSSTTAAQATGWSRLGCYTDSVNARTLTVVGVIPGGPGAMTIEACQQACQSQGYVLSGVEYTQECYCDNTLHNGGALAPDGDAQCNMACSGNAAENCGGPNRLNLSGFGAISGGGTSSSSVTPATTSSSTKPATTSTTKAVSSSTVASSSASASASPGWNAIGCYTDSVNTRTLTQVGAIPGGPGQMTQEACQAACKLAGYVLAGVEYSQECYCDNTFHNGGGPAPDGNVGCNMACSGNAAEMCGGSNRLNVFSYTSGPPPTGTTTTQAGPTTTAPSTATGLPQGWSYYGCWVDNANGRIMPMVNDVSTQTIESCIQTCLGQGHVAAGLEYSTQCYCGDAIYSGGALAQSDTECNMNCGGNANEKCGAGNRMSIYTSKKPLTVYAPAKAQTSGLPGNWVYHGCITDNAMNRSLAWETDYTDNAPTKCLNHCKDYGFMAGGMEYGNQCFCGDADQLISSGSTLAPETDCNTLCPGDGNYVCGAGNRINYYTWDGPNPLYKFNYASGNQAGAYQFLIGGVVVPLITTPGVNGKITFVEKSGTGPPNSTGAYELDLAMIPQGINAAWRTMHVKTDVFCSAGLTLPDKVGRQINVGGWSDTSTYGVRLYWPDGSPGVASKNDWQENQAEVSLQKGRWYPSAMIMTNGSILVVGGEAGSNGAPVPSLEILPNPPGGQVVTLDFLQRTDPFNLYPFLFVMPTGGIFIGYFNEARIMDEVTFATTKILPNLPCHVSDPMGGRTYPLEGTAMMLPQHAPYSDPVTILICGGSTTNNFALDNCVSTQPEVANPTWTLERMPSKRVMSCICALPDGTFLILNGAIAGQAGFGLARYGNHNAILYDPTQPLGQRMTLMANTTIDRLYHSEAVLLQDGRVLVSGSDPETPGLIQEYRVEVFVPPYLLTGLPQPTFSMSSKDWTYGQQITFTVGLHSGGATRVSLMGAESSTHGNSMGARTIFPAVTCGGTTCTVTAPPNAHICPPGWFKVFVLDGPTPSVAQWVRIGGDPASLGNWPSGFADFTPPGI